ncbi:MAG TPA: Y-family DNA polymerase [Firmicutes bacterium]|nr:Y-family DNA polymerase [Bacillota bacterium]
MFALVDCNNFYVSCERVFRPDLNGRPVVVLSNNDGCIIARSEEAKQLGIKMGEPAFKIAAFLEQNQVAVFSSNYVLYGDLSHRVMQTLGRFTPELEIYSIDEAFLNLTGLPVDWAAYARTIRETVGRHVGIPVSIGVAPTKVLAKVANHRAKKIPGQNGVCVLADPGAIEEALKNFDVGEVWGIGRQYAKLLNSIQVYTAWDFLQLDDDWVRKRMTVMGLRIKKELAGIACLEMELIPPAKKAICTSRSFGEEQTELEPINEAVATYAARCAEKLRRQRSCAGMLMVFLHTNGFKPHEPQYARNLVCKLPVPTNSTIELIRYASAALRAIYRKGYRYKKAGVIVLEIGPEERVQGSLFDRVDRAKHAAVMREMDAINAKYGRDTIKVAAQGLGGRWRLRQERLSPCYTTRWSDIIKVVAPAGGRSPNEGDRTQ